MGYKKMVKLDYTNKKTPGGKPLEVLKKAFSKMRGMLPLTLFFKYLFNLAFTCIHAYVSLEGQVKSMGKQER